MRLKPLLAVAATMLATSATFAVGGAATAADEPANLSDYLATQLPGLTGKTTVMVHGSSITAARQAASAAGLSRRGEFRRIGVVVAQGTKAQIQAVRTQPGVTYVEGGASRSSSSRTPPTPPPAAPRPPRPSPAPTAPRSTGNGVSVAVIDSGVDPTHPYFKEADGTAPSSANLKTLCDPLDADLLGRRRCPTTSTPTPCRSAATAPTSPASSPVARPR